MEHFIEETRSEIVTIDGDGYITIPPQFLARFNLKPRTLLSLIVQDGHLELRKKTDWTVDQLQQNDVFDWVIDDVTNNNQVHYILHQGKKFVLAPYSTLAPYSMELT